MKPALITASLLMLAAFVQSWIYQQTQSSGDLALAIICYLLALIVPAGIFVTERRAAQRRRELEARQREWLHQHFGRRRE